MARLNLNNLLKSFHLKICVTAHLYIYVHTNSPQHISYESLKSFFLGNYINIKKTPPAIEIDFLLLAFYEHHKINRIYKKLI